MKYSIKNMKTLTGGQILNFLKITKTWNFVSLNSTPLHSLTTVTSLEAANGHHFTSQQQTHQWDVPFRVPTIVGPLHLVVPFIFH